MGTPELVVLARGARPDDSPINQLLRRDAVIVLAPSLEALRRWLLHALVEEQQGDSSHNVVTVSDLSIDLTERRARWKDRELDLTERELEILTLLANDPGRAWKFRELVDAVWDSTYLGDSSAVRSAVKRLRRKLAISASSLVIESVRAVGYRLLIKPEKPIRN
jgi:DNA-binding response OmpR family regulator